MPRLTTYQRRSYNCIVWQMGGRITIDLRTTPTSTIRVVQRLAALGYLIEVRSDGLRTTYAVGEKAR